MRKFIGLKGSSLARAGTSSRVGPGDAPVGGWRRMAGGLAPSAGGGRGAGQDGFALVVALLALVGITALASAGYLLSNSDYRINQSHRAAVNAFYVADAGLERYLGDGRIWADSQVYAHPAGEAVVWATRLVDPDPESSLYRITSRGQHSPPEGGTAERTVSTVVILRTADFTVNSAFTAPPGLEKNGVAGVLSGFDSANPLDCGLTSPENVPGVSVPEGGLEWSGGEVGPDVPPPGVVGDPPVYYASEGDEGAMELLDATGIDWGALRSGAYVTADYVYSQDGWPDFSGIPADEYPFIIVDQDDFSVNPPQSGRGTLVVHGELKINGAWNWDGIVLVGGTLKSNGNNKVRGAIVAGLNIMLGEEVDEMQLGNGTWEYRYHSCNVIWALKGIGSVAEEPGTWSEQL